MRDYFGYEVVFVQNVTDVDDKVDLHLETPFGHIERRAAP
jgi:cysteinyl-tRNA synthetase